MKHAMFAIGLALLALGLLLAGCVASTPGTNKTATPANSSGSATTNQTGLVGADRDAHGCIPSAGYSWCAGKNKCLRSWEESCLRIYTESFPPFNYRDIDGSIAGSSTEMVEGILARTHTNATIEMKNWSEAYGQALNSSEIALYSIARTPEREAQFKWVGPLGEFEYALYARADSDRSITSLDSARKAGTICAVKDDARAQYLASQNFTDLLLEEEDAQCAMALATGQVNLWMGSSTSFGGVLRDAGLDASRFKKAYRVQTSQIYIAFGPQTADETVAAWQQALDAMKADGAYANITQRYNRSLRLGPGSDADAHGCIASAGYVWCGEQNRCIRPWEENCSTTVLGGDRDSHGCIPSAGYTWCEGLSQCIRPWEQNCTALNRTARAGAYCAMDNVAQVSVCGSYIKVVGSLSGAGTTFYSDDGTSQRCPLMALDMMTEKCRTLMFGMNCVDQVVCDLTNSSA